ncbi:MAG: hypothetical protein ACR2GH_23540, partial [Pseudonocardia sp.]
MPHLLSPAGSGRRKVLPVPGIDPDDLRTCLQVLAELDALPVEHPDAVAVRRATAGIYKSVKLRRRAERRDAVVEGEGGGREGSGRGGNGRSGEEE